MTFIKPRRLCLLVLALTLAWAIPPAARAADPIVSNQDIPLSATVSVPLPDNTAELVDLSAVVHTLTWIMPDAQNNCRVRFHANVDGVQGVGQTTGLKYLLTGASAIAHPADPYFSSVAPTFIFTLNAAGTDSSIPGNPVHPPDPCDISFSATLLENGNVTVKITDVSVPTIDE